MSAGSSGKPGRQAIFTKITIMPLSRVAPSALMVLAIDPFFSTWGNKYLPHTPSGVGNAILKMQHQKC